VRAWRKKRRLGSRRAGALKAPPPAAHYLITDYDRQCPPVRRASPARPAPGSGATAFVAAAAALVRSYYPQLTALQVIHLAVAGEPAAGRRGAGARTATGPAG